MLLWEGNTVPHTWKDFMKVHRRVLTPSPRLSSFTSRITRNSRKKVMETRELSSESCRHSTTLGGQQELMPPGRQGGLRVRAGKDNHIPSIPGTSRSPPSPCLHRGPDCNGDALAFSLEPSQRVHLPSPTVSRSCPPGFLGHLVMAQGAILFARRAGHCGEKGML